MFVESVGNVSQLEQLRVFFFALASTTSKQDWQTERVWFAVQTFWVEDSIREADKQHPQVVPLHMQPFDLEVRVEAT